MSVILPKKVNNSSSDDNAFNQSSNGDSASSSSQANGFISSTNFATTTTKSASTVGGGFRSADGQQQSQQPQMNLTQAGDNAAIGAEVLVNNDNSGWINKKWRPMLGWVYMAACITDFIIFPVLWSLLQALSKGSVTIQWQPVTLQGAGLFHISMGACIGVAAYGRTKEKLAEKA